MAFVWTDAAKAVGDLGSTVGGLMALLRGRDAGEEIPVLQSMVDAAEAARVYSKAAADPNSKYFKNLTALNEEAARRDFISAIRQMMLFNRRARARGTPGIGINPERRDEARSAAIASFFERARETARDQARQMLLTAAQGQASAAQGFGPAAGIYGTYGDYAANQRASLAEGLGKTAQALATTLGKVWPQEQTGPKPPAPLQTGPGYQDTRPYGASSLAEFMGYSNPNYDPRIYIER